MENTEEHEEMIRLLKENVALTQENNELLKKINRHNTITFWVRIAWFAVIVGMPFAVYFYFLQPYFEAFGANYELFRQGMAEIPGFKGIENILPRIGS